jgi:hypothetical protein
MKHAVCGMIVVIAVTSAIPAWGAPQAVRVVEVTPHPAQAAGMSLLAATVNLFYFPARLVVTIGTAGMGGLTGWFTGGDKPAARSVWDATDGQGFITPAILEGRERLRFGS